MSRPIKFRGISVRNGEWVYGDSIKHTDNPDETGQLADTTYIGNKVPNARRQGAMKWVPVDPANVCEFTGLTDVAGQPIYEGDIVINGTHAGPVKWMPGKCCFQISPWGVFLGPKCKVVGNIFDKQ